ncbi:hypothetical protein V6N13_128383 [Hibiscus sabdariffa]
MLAFPFVKLGTGISAYGCWVCLSTPLPENAASAEFLKVEMGECRIANSATCHVKNVWGKIKLQSHYAQEEFQRRAGFWGYLMQTIYQTCAGAVILTDLVFWLVIVPFLSNSHLGLNMLMGCMHTVNAVFLILDTLLNSLWVLHACGFTWWPYPFLELNTPWAPLWYFVLALVHIPCYAIYALIVEAKNSIFPRLFPHDFVRSY